MDSIDSIHVFRTHAVSLSFSHSFSHSVAVNVSVKWERKLIIGPHKCDRKRIADPSCLKSASAHVGRDLRVYAFARLHVPPSKLCEICKY